MIAVKPDPDHPRGGHAVLCLAEGILDGQVTQVSVFDNYSERYLGDSGWQASRVMFGPYALRHEDGELRLTIGPEIVNHIEEYANLRLDVGGVQQDVSWPDDIFPAPGAARIGGIMATSVPDAGEESRLTAQIPEPPGAATPALELQTNELDVSETEVQIGPESRKSGALISLLVLGVLGIGLAYWFLTAQEEAPETGSVPTPTPVEDACAQEALAGLDGFATQLEALRDCGGKTSADAALGLVERAAAQGNAEALTLFGTIYDGETQAQVIEDQIGLTFGDVPATAAEYYARAVAAGSEPAKERLAALCERMKSMTDTLARGAVVDHCER